jgi:hypothetical protein
MKPLRHYIGWRRWTIMLRLRHLYMMVGIANFHSGKRYFGVWYGWNVEPADYFKILFAIPVPGLKHYHTEACRWCAEPGSVA